MGFDWGGAATIGSSLIGSAGQLWANSSNSKEARKQREWQQYMSSTAHQREVKDLRAAGLNPILSATGGNGASTPSGAMARHENPAKDLSRDVFSAVQMREIQKEQLKNDTDLKRSNVLLNTQNAQYLAEQSKLASLNQKVASAQEASILADLPVKLALTGSHRASAAQSYGAANYSAAQIRDLERKKYNVQNLPGTVFDFMTKHVYDPGGSTKFNLPSSDYGSLYH